MLRAALLRIGDLHSGQVRRLRPVKAELGAPSGQHAGDDPVCTGDLQHCYAGLLGLGTIAHFSASVNLSQRRRISCRRCCQDILGRRSLRLSLALVLTVSRALGCRRAR
jgi:hypothetical protein